LDFPFVSIGGDNNEKSQITVLAFASPKVFYGDWPNGYVLGDENLLQIKHEADLVPRLPTKFKSLGTHYVIMDLAKSVLDDAKRRLTPRYAHDF
jgi:hypothetical protein